MKIVTLSDFATLHEAFKEFSRIKEWIFRGQSDAEWPLIPKAHRGEFRKVDDAQIFEVWKRRAIGYVDALPSRPIDCLALAQHHRLATRLLDWTLNPLTATYFANWNAGIRKKATDAAVYAVRFTDPMEPPQADPYLINRIEKFLPPHVSHRISQQEGVFTVHPRGSAGSLDQDSDLVEEVRKFVIPVENQEKILAELSFYGVNESSLFPDLDGLSEFVNWGVESGEYFKPAISIVPKDST